MNVRGVVFVSLIMSEEGLEQCFYPRGIRRQLGGVPGAECERCFWGHLKGWYMFARRPYVSDEDVARNNEEEISK